MAKGLAVKVEIRDHNRRLVQALLRVLATLCPLLPDRMTEWLANRILRLYWCECRVGRGPWQRVDHNLTVETVSHG